MKRQIRIGLVLSATLVVLGMTPGLAQESQHNEDWAVISANTTSPASAPWLIDTVDSASDVGRHVSVAVDAGSGMTFISYYDAANRDLRLARHVGSGGNCGPNDAWICETVDSDGDVGQYNSIATAPHIQYPERHGSEGDVGQYNLGDTELIIAYYDASNGALKGATGICSLSSCNIDTYTIDSGNPGISVYKGLYTSVKVDSGGVPHIAYQYHGAFSADAQLYAYMKSESMGNCGEGGVTFDWQCDLIYNAEGVGTYASLDLDGDGDPSIAFYDADNGYPLVATHVGWAGGNCGPNNDWYCRSVHRPTLDTGKYVSLYVEDSGLPHIAYHNVTSGTLEYAEWVGSGGNCGFNSVSTQWEWQCDEIDDTGTSLTSMGVALAEDGAGYPIIAYQKVSELDPACLKVARPHVALDPNTVPNCGPQDLFLTWYCESIDGGGSYTDEAGSVSLAVNSAGLATIAYHELDSYPYPTEGNLKVAYQRLQVFLPLALKNW